MKILVYGVLVMLAALAALRLLSRKLLYFPQPLEPGRQSALKNLEILGARLRPLEVRSEDGTLLKGWCLEKDVENLPVIFYFGGNAEEVSLNAEAFLSRVPANMVLVNYRGYGQSRGRPTEEALKADGLAVFDTLAQRYGLAPGSCLAWGRSLGSSVACWLARERGLGGLILTCPFDSIAAVAGGFYPGWLVRMVLPDTHRTTDFSGDITSSTLILAAEADEIIPFERTKALYDSLACARQLEIIKGAGHNTISEGPGYYETVGAFVGKFGSGRTEPKK